jgi:two-component system NtrC family sensor kinase
MKAARQRTSTPTKFHHGLAEKLSISLIISTAIIFAAYGWLNLRLQQKGAQDLILRSADGIGDLIKRSTRYQMLHNDREGLYQSIRDIGSEPGIERIRVFNKEGRIAFSTDVTEFNHVVSKQAPVCLACHSRPVPLLTPDRPERWHIFRNDRQQRVMAVVRTIENEKSCSDGACHAHPASTKVLGLIDTHLSLAAVDARVAEHRQSLIESSLAAVLLISAVSVGFVWRVVRRPIRELIAGTHRVAHGDLNHRLEVYSADELGELAWSFDCMTDQLAAAHDELTSWAKTLEDRVAAKTLELERVHNTLLASAKMASLGNLAATVAHEVNNPLFGILTYARLGVKDVEKNGGDPKMLERLHIIERESLRCGDIMRNLLTFARQTPKKREPCDVNSLIGHALALMKHKAELQGVAIETDLTPGVPQVDCDGGQIQQTVLVLLVNATEAMTSGGTLRINSELDSVRNEVRISVKDDGPGIPPAVVAKIFDPFFTTKEDQQRTGLGLAIARSIVEQHGGLLSVNSVEGEGAEFVFTLPLAPVEAMVGGVR